MQVAVSTLDVANLDEAHALIKLADEKAPIGGVFHLAMILSDRFMTNQVQPFTTNYYRHYKGPGCAPGNFRCQEVLGWEGRAFELGPVQHILALWYTQKCFVMDTGPDKRDAKQRQLEMPTSGKEECNAWKCK